MIVKIKPVNLALAVADGVSITINPFSLGSQMVSVKVILFKEDGPILNWDGTPIGVVTSLSEEAVSKIGIDNAFIEDYILSRINMERASN